MRAVALAGALSISAQSGGCRTVFTTIPEPIRIDNPDSLSAGQLGFVKGRTDFDEAERTMRRMRLTGIAKDMFTDVERRGGPLIQAIGADYQDRVHIFEGGRYLESVSLRCGSMLPYGPALRIAASGRKIFLLALYRDALDATDARGMAAPPRIDMFERQEGEFRFAMAVPLSAMSERHGGISRPLFVGHDLAMGISMIARDRGGTVWNGGYVVSMEGDRLRMRFVSLEEMGRCSCVQDYIYGQE